VVSARYPKVPDYDPENLTPQQYAALTALAIPLAIALKVGVPIEAVEEHVRGVLDKVRTRLPAE
jgi:hypothetical protein